MPDHLLHALTPLNNLRDLGGTVVQGGRIRPGLLWRSDDVSTVPVDEAQSLVARGLRTILDLRSFDETVHTGRGPLGAHDVNYLNLPLASGVAAPTEFTGHLRNNTGTPQIVGKNYADTAFEQAGTIARGLGVIARADGAVLFHCAAGKDRTGIFAAGLLAVLGASDDVIVEDYALSELVLPQIMTRVTAVIGTLLGEAAPYFAAAAHAVGPVNPLLGAHPDSMAEMLHLLHRERGGFAAVIRESGLDTDTESLLRDRLIEPDPMFS